MKKFASDEIIIVDGLVGGGKGAFINILSSLDGVEMWKHSSTLELVCNLYLGRKINLISAKELINDVINTYSRELALARNMNPNFYDQSSIFQDLRFRYFRRIFRTPKIFNKHSVTSLSGSMCLMTHSNTQNIELLSSVISKPLKYFWFVRHPLSVSMIKHVAKWVRRWEKGEGPNKFFLREEANYKLPLGLDEESIASFKDENYIGKSIIILESWYKSGYLAISKNYQLKNLANTDLRIVSFEKFIVETDLYINSINRFLNTKSDIFTKIAMIRQHLPRAVAEEKRVHHDYDYVSTGIQSKSIDLISKYFGEEVSKGSLSRLDELAYFYEEKILELDCLNISL